MPKIKEKINNKIEPVKIDDMEEKEIDPEGILGAGAVDEEAEETEDGGLDEDEIDPFKDKYEE